MEKFTFADYVKEENTSSNLEELNEKFKTGDIKFDYNLVFEVDGHKFKSYRDFNPSISLDVIKNKPVDITYISETGGHLCFEYVLDAGKIIPTKVYIKDNTQLEKNADTLLTKLGMK